MILFTNPVPAYSKSVRIHRAKVTFHLQPERPWAVFFHYETHKDTGQKNSVLPHNMHLRASQQQLYYMDAVHTCTIRVPLLPGMETTALKLYTCL